MQLKITRSTGAVEYKALVDITKVMEMFRDGQIKSIEPACIFEALPNQLTIPTSSTAGHSNVVVSRLVFCKMVSAMASDNKIMAVKWVKDTMGWGLKDSLDLVSYCMDSFPL